MTGEQVKQIRIALDLSQKEYGERFGASRDMVANMENGRVEVKDFISRHIITVFRVNEAWAETGVGEMFVDVGNDFVAEMAAKYQLNDFQQILVRAVYEMPPELQDMVVSLAHKLAAEDAARGTPQETEHERIERIANQHLAAYDAEQARRDEDQQA